jgi:transposase-like protein
MDSIDFTTLAKHFADADGAREFLETIRWPNGAICPHCGSVEAYKLTAKEGSKTPVRKGVYKCKACRKQFTVTVGTIFEDSRIPLNKWLYAIFMMCSSKKGVSAHQLHRTLGITYKSAWFMCHRIRYAMSQSPLAEKLSGIVEVDETYVGGKPRKENKPQGSEKEVKKNKRGRGTDKTPVVVVVERDGKSRAKKMEKITAKNLREHVEEHVSGETRIMTDGFSSYKGIGKNFQSHETVDHGAGELARGDVNTNTAESWFALLKRGVIGTFHHVSDQHLDRYIDEFVFRWDSRKETDFQRTMETIKAVKGKRLMRKDLMD